MNKYYTSTRNGSVQISAKQAIKKGFADDKGLFVYPDLEKLQVNFEKLLKLNYQDIARAVLTILLPDFSADEIDESVRAAYQSSFDTQKITPVIPVDDFHILELFHGPTSAFKDVGLQLLPQLMKHVLVGNNKVMILTATSGDTGKAALEGFKGLDNMGIIVFYPDGGVSKIQKLQMITTGGNNTKVAAIEGNFDAILIICPASLKSNWFNELTNYVAERDISIIGGVNEMKKGEIYDKKIDVCSWVDFLPFFSKIKNK